MTRPKTKQNYTPIKLKINNNNSNIMEYLLCAYRLKAVNWYQFKLVSPVLQCGPPRRWSACSWLHSYSGCLRVQGPHDPLTARPGRVSQPWCDWHLWSAVQYYRAALLAVGSSASSLVSICVFSSSVSLFLFCKWHHLYQFFFQIPLKRIDKWYLFFSFWLTSLVWQTQSPPLSLQRAQVSSFL